MFSQKQKNRQFHFRLSTEKKLSTVLIRQNKERISHQLPMVSSEHVLYFFILYLK